MLGYLCLWLTPLHSSRHGRYLRVREERIGQPAGDGRPLERRNWRFLLWCDSGTKGFVNFTLFVVSQLLDIQSNRSAARSFPALLGYGAALAASMGAFEFTGGSLWGYNRGSTEDEFDRRQQLRKAYRTSGEETVAQLGEGRGKSICVDHVTDMTPC